MRPLVVIEANEVPLSLLQWYSELRPRSTIAELLRGGERERSVFGETIVEEDPSRELYPSQTWATFATGVSYDKHGIYWYGDPKPDEFPLYWQVAAQSRSVGFVGTLHSSPLLSRGPLPGLRFALPDSFAPDASALPRSLESLQRFNLAMTASNARAVGRRQPARALIDGAAAVARNGIGLQTATALAYLLASMAARRASRERLRTAQFLLLGDVFERLTRDHQPDLAVLFTNHVAAAMHRYWPASFPGDWEVPPYGPEWVDRFRGEIPAAVDALDRLLARLLEFCRQTDRTLLVASSMGQVGGLEVDRGGDRILIVEDATAFARGLGVAVPFQSLSAMVPHVTLRFDDAAAATAEQTRLGAIVVDGQPLRADRSGNTVTVTYQLGDRSSVQVGDSSWDPADLGLRWRSVQEHKSGRHMPRGVLLVANSPSRELPTEPVPLEHLAPAILESLGVEPLVHHSRPLLRL